MRSFLLFLSLFGTASTNFAEDSGPPLRIVAWNVESGGAAPAVIAKQLTELPRADAYLLQEVAPKDIGRYAAAIRDTHGEGYKYYLGSLGGSDRLAFVIDDERLRIRSFSELISFEKYTLNDWRHRPPLVARVRCVADDTEALLVNVHLARGNDRLRTEQAEGLREWAKAHSLPIVLAGDCNFDYEFSSGQGNAAHKAFFAGSTWREIAPEERVDTNWSDRNNDGQDDYPGSSLDFAAYASRSSKVRGEAKVLVREGDFPDTESTSDHRPIWLSVEFPKR